jgi:hypothetical protein
MAGNPLRVVIFTSVRRAQIACASYQERFLRIQRWKLPRRSQADSEARKFSAFSMGTRAATAIRADSGCKEPRHLKVRFDEHGSNNRV